MLNLYPTKKAIISAPLDIHFETRNEMEQEQLQNWYVGIAGTGFHEKYLVLYVHNPSLLTVIVEGKTVEETFKVFTERLQKLLTRFSFPQNFIGKALRADENYTVFKPYDSRLISQINQFTKLISYSCSKSRTYEAVNIDAMENKLMRHIYQYNSSKTYPPPLLYWEQQLNFKSQTTQVS